jgi:hypothetical protein
MKAVMKLIGIDPGKRVTPVVSVRAAKQRGHTATFPQDQCLGVLPARDVPSAFLDATNEAFEIMIGTRQQRLLQVRKEMGSKRDRELLKGGHSMQQVGRKPAVFKLLNTCQELRLRFFAAGLGLQEMSQLINPAEEPYEVLVFRVA